MSKTDQSKEKNQKKTVELTARMREFARLVVASRLSKPDAYRRAFNRNDMSGVAASKAASRLSKNSEVCRFMDELAAELDKEAIASRQECLEFLTSIIRTPVGQVTAESPLAQELNESESGVRIKMPGKIEAVRELAKLAGYNEPERVDVNANLIGQILSGLTSEPLVRD